MSRNKELLFLVSLMTGTIIVPVNSTMIAVGLSDISRYFHQSLSSISWVVTIYLIAMAVTQPIAGKLGDIYGHRRIYLWGLLLFFISSIACAFSFNLLWLITFRSLQAIGGALITPNVMAIIRFAVSKDRLPKILGLLGMSMGLGAAFGPLLGATLIDAWGWKSIFWVNVPLLCFSIAATPFVLPKHDHRNPVELDLLGSFYLAVSFSLLILLTHPQSLMGYLVMGVLLVLFVVLFVRREMSIQDPLINFSLFNNRTFTTANISILLNNFVMYATLLVMPIILESDFKLSTQKIGLILFVLPISMSLAGWMGGQLTARLGNRKMIALSFIISAVAGVLYLGMSLIETIPYLIFSLIVGGIAAGVGMSAMQTASLHSVRKELSGTASGIFSTFRYFGSMISSTLVSLLAGSPKLFVLLIIMSVLGVMVSWGIALDNKIPSKKMA